MATNVDIVNRAFDKLGIEAITTLSDSSKQARWANRNYDALRRKLLRGYWWNFALKRATLTDNGTTPDSDFTHEFNIPSDCLRILRLKFDQRIVEYSIENEGKIAANAETLSIVYIEDVTTVDSFDFCFQEALAFLIASEASFPLLQSTNTSELMYQKYINELKDIRSIDAQEGSPQALYADEWLSSRLTGSFTGRDNGTF